MGQIKLHQVTKSFGDTNVIPPLDLTIEDGEFTVFVGPSGCGKSTLLRLIAGLEDITSGHIEIDGADATNVPPAKRGLAMVFQSYALYPHMSVRKNIAFEHSVANMYFFPQSWMAGSEVAISEAVANLVWVTVGNVVGGAGGVALAYRFAYIGQQSLTRPDPSD